MVPQCISSLLMAPILGSLVGEWLQCLTVLSQLMTSLDLQDVSGCDDPFHF